MSVCPECHVEYSAKGGGHCRGGVYGGCCKTFASDIAADAHFEWVRVSPSTTNIRCRTTEEMLAMKKPFRETPRGWTNSRLMTEEEKARVKGAPRGKSAMESEVAPDTGPCMGTPI